MTSGTLETDSPASELMPFESIFATAHLSAITTSMFLISVFAIHVSFKVGISGEADITYMTDELRIVIHLTVIHPEVYTVKSCSQLKVVEGWGTISRLKNVSKTFLTLHHFLVELHHPLSIFRSWVMHLRCPQCVELASASVVPMTSSLTHKWQGLCSWHLFPITPQTLNAKWKLKMIFEKISYKEK